MTTVYICFVSTGEYSDRTEWPLHGYYSEQEAEDFVLRSQELFNKRWVQVKAHHYEKRSKLFPVGWHPECPSLGGPDYTGFSFWFEPVEIKS